MRQLAEQDPSNAEWQRGLAISYWRLGRIMAQQSRENEASEAIQEAIAIYTRLVEVSSDHPQFKEELQAILQYKS